MNKVNDLPVDIRIIRPVVIVPFHLEDQTIETVQGKSESVSKLYQDYVLGRLDQSQIGGEPVYDPDDAIEVDPFNHFGITLEETTALAEQGRDAYAAAQKHLKEKEAAKKQDAKSKQDDITSPPGE